MPNVVQARAGHAAQYINTWLCSWELRKSWDGIIIVSVPYRDRSRNGINHGY